jgi:hypothetical protein
LTDADFFYKTTNFDMEGVMTNYSELIVFFLFLPVLTQIIIPLLMLVGFGVVRAMRTVFGSQGVAESRTNGPKLGEELQLGRS